MVQNSMHLATTITAALAGATLAFDGFPSLSQLPRLNVCAGAPSPRACVSISGISSGADFAAQFAVAYSSVIAGVGIFAGQPWHCAVTHWSAPPPGDGPGEPLFTCAQQPTNQRGPGCAGMPGMAGCDGCPAGLTVGYDHCKTPNPSWVNITDLRARAEERATNGSVLDLAGMSGLRTYLYRGTLDSVYLPGSVNATEELFLSYASDPSQVVFEAGVPSSHCMPTIDPWLSNATCGVSAPWAPPAIQNCGYDGAGAALQHIYGGVLAPPAVHTPTPSHVYTFNQTAYFGADGRWPALASTGYAYIPPACFTGASCLLHVALHGCGMSALNPVMNTSFVLHAGFGPWADANNIAVIFPQSGGFIERNVTAPSAQLAAGCYDSYGQTAWDYDLITGPQMVAIRNMIAAVTGQ